MKTLGCKLSIISMIFVFVLTGQITAQNAVITGQVLNTETGEPISGATVIITQLKEVEITDPNGLFKFDELKPDTYTIQVSFVGFETIQRNLTVKEGQTNEVELELKGSGIAMTGIVVSSLRPDLQPESQIGTRQVREETPNDSGELLRIVSGVDAVRRGPIGLDPVVRGLRETEVGTYLDGTRIFPAGPARMDSPLSHLDPSNIQSMEVVKGPYALTWGAGNLSAIRVKTQDLSLIKDNQTNGRVGFGFQSNIGALETTGSLSSRKGPLAVGLNVAWREGNEFEGGNDVTVPGDFLSREVRGKASYSLNENSTLTASFGFQNQEDLRYPGRLLNAESFDSYNSMMVWDKTSESGLLRKISMQGYFNKVNHKMNNDDKPTAQAVSGRIPPFALDINVDSGIEIIGGSAAFTLKPSQDWQIKTGVDIYSANRDAVRFVRRAENQMLIFKDQMWPDATITTGGVYTQLEHNVSEKITSSGTLRLDLTGADANSPSDFFLDNVSEDLEETEVNLSAAYSTNISLNQYWNLSLGAGTAVRTADVNERYSDRIPASKAQTSAEFVGNTQLDPERSSQIDMWLEANYPRFHVKTNLFVRRISDYITLRPTDLPKRLPLSPETVFQYRNGKADFWGAEASAGYQIWPQVTANASINFLWGEDKTVDEPVLGITPFTFEGSLRYEPFTINRLFAEVRIKVADDQNRVAVSRGERPTDGYQVVDLKAGYEVLKGLMIRAGVENLFDANYVNHLNANNPFAGIPIADFRQTRIPEPGRVFNIDIQYRF